MGAEASASYPIPPINETDTGPVTKTTLFFEVDRPECIDCVAAVDERSLLYQSRYYFVGVAGVVVPKGRRGQGRRVIFIRRKLHRSVFLVE